MSTDMFPMHAPGSFLDNETTLVQLCSSVLELCSHFPPGLPNPRKEFGKAFLVRFVLAAEEGQVEIHRRGVLMDNTFSFWGKIPQPFTSFFGISRARMET